MIEHGPVDLFMLAVGEPRFDGKILAELKKQVAAGTIRVLDAMILVKDVSGVHKTLDIEDIPQTDKDALGFLKTETHGLFDSADATALFDGMKPGSAVIGLAIEHVWAVPLVNAIADNKAEIVLNIRVPAPIVEDAFTSLI